MYLGRHFLGDVLGGIALGGAVLAIAYLCLDRWGLKRKLFERTNLQLAAKLPNVLLYTSLLAVPLLLGILSPNTLGKGAGYLVGANAAFILTLVQGFDDDAASLPKRAIRVSLGLLLYFGTLGIAELILEPTGLEAIAFVDEFVKSAVLVFVSLYGAHFASDRLIAKSQP
jgi:hypothetical protein